MIMMTKKRTSALAGIKMLIVIPVLAIVFLAISASKSELMPPPPPPPPPPHSTELKNNIEVVKEESVDDPGPAPFVVVEVMPLFPGGDAALLKHIRENTHYPQIAKENNIQGKVIIRFSVTDKGSVNRISVLKGVDPELDKEAIRVVKTLPAFIPGSQGGKPVPVWYMVPITFTLK